jgi:hypothetical protein
MECLLVRDEKSKPPCARDKSRQRFAFEFASLDVVLIDAERGQEWQASRMAQVSDAVQVTIGAIHLPSRLRPRDAARFRDVSIGRADLTDRGILQVFQCAIEIEPLRCLRTTGALLQELLV